MGGLSHAVPCRFITAPIDLIKIQEQMDFSSSSSSHRDGANVRSVSYSIPRTRLQSLRDATMTTVRTMKRVWRDGSQRQSPTGRSSSWLGGVRAMYRGLSVTCMRDVSMNSARPRQMKYSPLTHISPSWTTFTPTARVRPVLLRKCCFLPLPKIIPEAKHSSSVLRSHKPSVHLLARLIVSFQPTDWWGGVSRDATI